MKNLNNKIILQTSECLCISYRDKQQIYIGFNLIGFGNEFYFPDHKEYMNCFYNFDHFVNEKNKKLYKKYPSNVTKKDYKEWLKSFNI